MISCSMIESLMLCSSLPQCVCMMNTSLPRMLSLNRVRISPLANWMMPGSPNSMPRFAATSFASAGWVRPVRSVMRLVVNFSIVEAPRYSVGRSSVEGSRRTGGRDRAAGRQVGVGADVRVLAHLAVAADAVLDHRSGPDHAVDQSSVGPDLAAVADHRVALQDRSRVQGDITAQLHGDVDERLPRVEHGDTVEQPVAVGAAAQFALGQGQLPAIV